jgi:hypothetical protein
MPIAAELAEFLGGADADPSVQYGFLRDLEGRSEDDPDVRAIRERIGQEGWAAQILQRQQVGGHWETLREGRGDDLYQPKYIATNWSLLILADLGATRHDPRVARATDLVFRLWDGPDGVFGGPGSEHCITGNTARMMLRFGFGDDPRVHAALDWLVASQKPDGGWHCFESPNGTLDCWEALAAFAAIPPAARSPAIRTSLERGAEFYLSRGLLTESDGSTGAPWHRLHYPVHYYYDLLVGLDVLTALGFGRDARLGPALDELEAKRQANGTWTLEAVHPDLEPSDPYHPRRAHYPVALEPVGLPSRWITLTALKVLRRAGRA